jgi:hypothetical protein
MGLHGYTAVRVFSGRSEGHVKTKGLQFRMNSSQVEVQNQLLGV